MAHAAHPLLPQPLRSRPRRLSWHRCDLRPRAHPAALREHDGGAAERGGKRATRGATILINLIILGYSGTAADVIDSIDEINSTEPIYHVVGVLDDDPLKWGLSSYGIHVLGTLARASDLKDVQFVNALGSPSYFWRLPDIILGLGMQIEQFTSIIHPSTSISKRATIGQGTLIFAQTTISAHAQIGKMNQILANSVISHDVRIGDFSIIGAGALLSGGVHIGQSCYIGTGSVIHQGVSVGDGALIGMGAVVLHDVAPKSVMVGNPAHQLRVRE